MSTLNLTTPQAIFYGLLAIAIAHLLARPADRLLSELVKTIVVKFVFIRNAVVAAYEAFFEFRKLSRIYQGSALWGEMAKEAEVCENWCEHFECWKWRFVRRYGLTKKDKMLGI